MLHYIKRKLRFLAPVLPYGVMEPWDDLNPKLYLAIHIYWLKVYGMWYNKYKPKDIRYWVHIMYTAIVLWLVCILSGIGEVFYLLRRRDNIGTLAEGLYLFLSEVYTYFKVVVFWLNKSKICELLEYLHCQEFQPKEEEHRSIVRRSIAKARWVMTAYSTMCVVGICVGLILPLTENFDILPTNVEYPFFDAYKSPAYEFFYVQHVYYKPATVIIYIAIDTLLAAFLISAIGQIEILAFNLRNFPLIAARRRGKHREGPLLDSDYRAVLTDCIRHHNSIIKYVSMIESAFSLVSALQFMLSGMVFSLAGIQFLLVEDPSSHPTKILWIIVYLTSMLCEVFIYCWFGDDLILKSIDLRQAAFDGPWIKLSPATAKYIIVFLERCKRPLQVTAVKVFILSLDTFTSLIKWSYNAFAVMRNMKK